MEWWQSHSLEDFPLLLFPWLALQKLLAAMKQGIWSVSISLIPSQCFLLSKALKNQMGNSDAQAQTYLCYENIFYQMQ